MKDISLSFLTTILIQTVNILTGLLAARFLLPEGRGELAEIMLWPGLLMEFGILAMSDALLYRAATRAAPPKVLFATVIWIGIGLTAVLTTVGYLVIPYMTTSDTATVQAVEGWYIAAYVPVYLFSLFVATMFQGHLDLVAWNVVRALVGLGYLGFIGILHFAGRTDVGSFAAAYIGGTLISGVVGFLWLARKGWVGWRPDYATAKGLLGYGARLHLGEMVNSLRQRVDQMGVSLYLSASDMGHYVVALTVANGPMILVNTVAGVAFPKISQAPDPAEKLRIFGTYLRLAMALSVASAAGLAVLAPFLVPLIFGQAFEESAVLCQIMLIGLPFFAAKLMFIQALNAFDKSLAIGWAEGAGLLAAIASLALLMPAIGIRGAAWALVVANVVALLAMAGMLRQRIGSPTLVLFRPTADDVAQVRRVLARVLP
ncbi:MAG: oligosaccharide flippase family protein [Rhodospirillales bacterium]|nr:oligosaccharide flippase family protein [Rhodospirillales bacterium]